LTGRIGSAFVVIGGIRNARVAENWKLQARRSHVKGDDSARWLVRAHLAAGLCEILHGRVLIVRAYLVLRLCILQG